MTDEQPRTRHVWVRPAYDGVGKPKPGLVVSWRLEHSQTSGPRWQALVMVVDDKDESARMEWFDATRLSAVKSDPPS